jgi:2-hydroxy-3-keto-5-methylthiopentenyl-1-phosphate phosphatase
MGRLAQDWMVVCDFDGTISTVDVTDELLKAHADERWLDIEEEWKDGRIGSRECLSRQIDLLAASPADVDALADRITIDPHFKSFVDFCDAAGVPITIVSDGLDGVIERILFRHDLGHIPVFANALLATGRQSHRLVSPYFDGSCHAGAGTCKCAVIEGLKEDLQGRKIMFVGDGRSDFCAARRMSDVVAAKSKLLTYMRGNGGPGAVPYDNFAEVKALLAQLVSETVTVEEESTSV